MRFFTDQNIPESVAQVLEGAGYDVIRLRERIATDTPDPLVAAIAEANSAILVTMDPDFKNLAQRRGIGRRRFRRLSLIRFEGCREPQAARRLASALSLIQHEWKVGSESSDRRMFISIGMDVIRTYR